MSNELEKPLKRKSTKLHQQQTFWQIIFPLVLFSLIIISMCVMVVFNSGTNTIQNQHFANIATMYLFIPPLLISLPIIIILVALIFLLGKVFPYISLYSGIIQDKLAIVREMIKKGMDSISQPFIQIPAYASSIKTLFSEIYQGLRRFTHYE